MKLNGFYQVLKHIKSLYPYYLGKKPVYDIAQHLDVVDKYTGKLVSKVCAAPPNVIKQAIGLATQSFPKIQALPSFTRKQILLNVASSLRSRQEELSQVLAVEIGKPISDANMEIERAIDTFTISAEEAVRLNGQFERLDISPRNAGFQSIQSRFPIGLISMIVPFNFPINLAAHKIGPAIAIGCPFILKPSDRTPISATILGEILSESDLPDGSFSILPCLNEHAHCFSDDEGIKVISFTGSAKIGWKIHSMAGKKRTLLELGGNAAVIVDRDVENIHKIAERIITGSFGNCGQSCISVQRIYAHEEVFDRLVTLITDLVPLKIHIGDPLDPKTTLGPMISETESKRLESWTQSAITQGGKLLMGGSRRCAFFSPTLLTNVPKTHELHCEEAFGPIAIIEKYSNLESVINEINKSQFGLQAGIFTKNVDKIFYAWNSLEVGGVVINDVPSVRVDSQPYGGVKDSGFGREGVRYTMEDLSQLRVLLLKDIGTHP